MVMKIATLKSLSAVDLYTSSGMIAAFHISLPCSEHTLLLCRSICGSSLSLCALLMLDLGSPKRQPVLRRSACTRLVVVSHCFMLVCKANMATSPISLSDVDSSLLHASGVVEEHSAFMLCYICMTVREMHFHYFHLGMCSIEGQCIDFSHL